jgi:hypothetical protein
MRMVSPRLLNSVMKTNPMVALSVMVVNVD